MPVLQKFTDIKQIKNIYFKYCNQLKELFYNTSTKNHFFIQNCNIHSNKILIKYHTSWYYGILQVWLILLRIRPKEFF